MHFNSLSLSFHILTTYFMASCHGFPAFIFIFFYTIPITDGLNKSCVLWKALFLVSVSKNGQLPCLSNPKLVAHTSPIMKTLYRLVIVNLRPLGNPSLGPLQFICQPHDGVWMMQWPISTFLPVPYLKPIPCTSTEKDLEDLLVLKLELLSSLA